MASRLPDHPSIERLRRDARRLQRRVAGGDDHGLELVRRHHPGAASALADRTAFRLADAQLTVARAYGFSGWPALVRYLGVAAELSRTPGDVAEDRLDVADLFASLACLRYDPTDSPERRAEAERLLEGDPHLPDRSVAAAAAAASLR